MAGEVNSQTPKLPRIYLRDYVFASTGRKRCRVLALEEKLEEIYLRISPTSCRTSHFS
jgi:hypothetical protein